MSRRKDPSIPNDILDQLLAGTDAAAALSQGGLLDTLKKAFAERALNAEMDHHLGQEEQGTNSRNGYGRKTVTTDGGRIEIEVPRDRAGSFDPQLIAKYQRRFPGFDDKIISLYSRGMTVREIQSHLSEMYGTEISPTLISTVTDAVSEEVKQWQSRPLDAVYPVVYLDCIHVKVRDAGAVRAKAIYLAIGINMEGEKEVLGLWIAQTEGAKFWLGVVTELKNRGVQDIFIACVDGLKGFPEAIEAVYPQTAVQLCVVHMVRTADEPGIDWDSHWANLTFEAGPVP